jgi:uncharacterized protein
MRQCIIVFVKNLIPGQVKTRLAADIGDTQAIDVYRKLVQHTLDIADRLPVDQFIYYSHFIPTDDPLQSHGVQSRIQLGEDLGMRMYNALAQQLESYDHVVLVGSDIADIDEGALHTAFDALNYIDVVIGPAQDGGYYLIGCTTLWAQLFRGIRWSTPAVFGTTCKHLIDMSLDFKLLETKTDIDTVQDLSGFPWLLSSG